MSLSGQGPVIRRRAVVGGLAFGAAALAAPTVLRAGRADRAMADAVNAWLSSLDATQRRTAMMHFGDSERFDWHFTPRRRRGLPLAAMTEGQRTLAHRVLRTGLSEAGYRKATDIIRLEAVLREIETFGFSRDPERYYMTVFGTPGPTGAWGWRFEGHHLSLNMTFRDEQLVGATPHFLGANPAIVPVGHLKGLQVLETEIGIAVELLRALDGAGRSRAIIAERAFGDIVAGPGREERLQTPEGLPASAMTSAQRDLVVRLVETYAGNLPAAWADAELDRIRAAGLDALHFAWAGAPNPGPRRGHYFRVHGPTVLIEYDNSRGEANHVHSVWHDPTNPFGRDVLGAHYRHGHQHA